MPAEARQVGVTLEAGDKRRDAEHEVHDVEPTKTAQADRRREQSLDGAQWPAPLDTEHRIGMSLLASHAVRQRVDDIVAKRPQSAREVRLHT